MSRLVRGVIIAAAIPAVGYVLMKATSPSPEEMEKKLGYMDKASLAQIRKQNRDFMKVLQKEAGITDEELKKKNR